MILKILIKTTAYNNLADSYDSIQILNTNAIAITVKPFEYVNSARSIYCVLTDIH